MEQLAFFFLKRFRVRLRVAATLQILYKLKTAKLFDGSKCRGSESLEFPYAVQLMYFCVESRLLCIAGSGYIVLFRFSKQESLIECPVSYLFVRKPEIFYILDF